MGTLEGSFAGVRPHVSLKKPRPRERFPTDGAVAGQRVRPDVHLQRPYRRVDPLAPRAVVATDRRRGLLRCTVCRPLVLGQSVERRVGLSAGGALERIRFRFPSVG